jgi:hypothetical protein
MLSTSDIVIDQAFGTKFVVPLPRRSRWVLLEE